MCPDRERAMPWRVGNVAEESQPQPELFTLEDNGGNENLPLSTIPAQRLCAGIETNAAFHFGLQAEIFPSRQLN